MAQSKLTTRSQEAVTAAQRLAVERGQADLQPLHLLSALLEQSDGIAAPLLKAVGAEPADVRAKTEAALKRLPSVSGATVPAPSPSRELLRVLNLASEQASALGGEVEHAQQFAGRSEEHTSELQSHVNLVCRLLLEKKKHETTPRKLRPHR